MTKTKRKKIGKADQEAPPAPARIRGAPELVRALAVTPGRVKTWLLNGVPHRLEGRVPTFDLQEVGAWLERRAKAEADELERQALKVVELSANGRVAFVRPDGVAKLGCEECRREGAPEASRRRRRLRKDVHRAFRRWRLGRHGRAYLQAVIQCGACWHTLLRKRAEKVPGADRVPIANEEPARQEALFA